MAILRLHVQFFFVLCLLVLRARIISWRVSWFPQCILGRHWTREILEPRGFLINTDPGAIFPVYESVKGSGNSAFLQKDQLCYLKRAEKLTFCIYFYFSRTSLPSPPLLFIAFSNFHRFLYSTPLSNIWTLGTGYLPSNSLPDLWVEGRYTGVHR